jgi:hypothetical protein
MIDDFHYIGPIYMGSNAKELMLAYDTASDVRKLKLYLNLSSGLLSNQVNARRAKALTMIRIALQSIDKNLMLHSSLLIMS